MADEKKGINEELLMKLIEEVHLLYHLEKEVASIKSDIGGVQSLKKEFEDEKGEGENEENHGCYEKGCSCSFVCSTGRSGGALICKL